MWETRLITKEGVWKGAANRLRGSTNHALPTDPTSPEAADASSHESAKDNHNVQIQGTVTSTLTRCPGTWQRRLTMNQIPTRR
eukprot:2125178-Rhodomonas_salina.1